MPSIRTVNKLRKFRKRENMQDLINGNLLMNGVSKFRINQLETNPRKTIRQSSKEDQQNYNLSKISINSNIFSMGLSTNKILNPHQT